MAAFLSLRDKVTGEIVTGAALIKLDGEICEYLGVEVHPEKWVHYWMDRIGFSLALGKSFDEVLEGYRDDPKMFPIATYLDSRFENCSYYSM